MVSARSLRFFRDLCLRFFFTVVFSSVFTFSLTCFPSFSMLSFCLLVVYFFSYSLDISGGSFLLLPANFVSSSFTISLKLLAVTSSSSSNLFFRFISNLSFMPLSFLWALLVFCSSSVSFLPICDQFLCQPLWPLHNVSLFLFGYSKQNQSCFCIWWLPSPVSGFCFFVLLLK